MPASSTADQGLAATEAPKPATDREPEPAAPAQATASSSQSPVGTEDGTSSTLTTSVPDSSLDRAAAPGPDRTPIASISSVADKGLSATEAPKPASPKHAIKRAPKSERAARAQATASLAPSPGGTADGTSSTLAIPVAAAPLSHRNLLVGAPTENVAAAKRDANRAGLFRSGPKLAGDRGSEARNFETRNSETRNQARAETGAGGPCAGNCQFGSVPSRDRGRNVIDAQHPHCGAPIAIS